MALPKWLRDIDASLQIRSQFVLFGNIRDQVLTGAQGIAATPLVGALWSILEPRDFGGILVWDPIDGLTSYPDGRDLEPIYGSLAKTGRKFPDDLVKLIRIAAVPDPGMPPLALLFDHASRIDPLLRDPEVRNPLLRMPEQLFVAAERSCPEPWCKILARIAVSGGQGR